MSDNNNQKKKNTYTTLEKAPKPPAPTPLPSKNNNNNKKKGRGGTVGVATAEVVERPFGVGIASLSENMFFREDVFGRTIAESDATAGGHEKDFISFSPTSTTDVAGRKRLRNEERDFLSDDAEEEGGEEERKAAAEAAEGEVVIDAKRDLFEEHFAAQWQSTKGNKRCAVLVRPSAETDGGGGGMVPFLEKDTVGFAHHCLFALPPPPEEGGAAGSKFAPPIALRGPCVVVAVCGAVSVCGFVLQEGEWLEVPSANISSDVGDYEKLVGGIPLHSAIVQPRAEAERARQPDSGGITVGRVDVDWVKRATEFVTSNQQKQKFAVALVLQSPEAARKRWRRVSSTLPACISRFPPKCVFNEHVAVVHTQREQREGFKIGQSNKTALLSVVQRNIVISRCAPIVAVVGAQRSGKSTFCRHICNAILSRFGRCAWVDLDLGQPEFTPPGCFSITMLTNGQRPLFSPHQHRGGREGGLGVFCLYVGGSKIRCPVALSKALMQLCCEVRRVSREQGCPIVVNTHGWTLSTGRRTTQEALNRLQPTAVVHLKTSDDEPWLLPSKKDSNQMFTFADSRNGINSSIVELAMFGPPATVRRVPPLAPPPLFQQEDREERSCSVVVVPIRSSYPPPMRRQYNNKAQRRQLWMHHFSLPKNSSQTNFNDVCVGRRAVRLVFTGDEVARPTTEAAVQAALVGSVVGICTADNSESGNTHESHVALLSELVFVPKCHCFGVVVAIDNISIQLRVPKHYTGGLTSPGGAWLRHLGANCVVYSEDRDDTDWIAKRVLE